MILDLDDLVQKYSLDVRGVLHIGAHHGQEYSTYKRLNISPIVFVEALPHTYNILTQNVGPECICINVAIGNHEGVVSMYVDEANTGGSSSVLKPKIHLQQYPHIQFPYQVDVPITKIDTLDLPLCNFINMDIQGYELEALKGAAIYLNTVDYLMLEINRAEVYENCAQIEQVDQYLLQYGFIRVETDWAGHTWGDGFYIKTKK
jgi:FkbM family methyltransferase